MLAEKRQALAQIALIGFQRLGRQAAFAAQMRQPVRDFSLKVQRRTGEARIVRFGFACGGRF